MSEQIYKHHLTDLMEAIQYLYDVQSLEGLEELYAKVKTIQKDLEEHSKIQEQLIHQFIDEISAATGIPKSVFVTKDGCCEACGKPASVEELRKNWYIYKKNYCDRCVNQTLQSGGMMQ